MLSTLKSRTSQVRKHPPLKTALFSLIPLLFLSAFNADADADEQTASEVAAPTRSASYGDHSSYSQGNFNAKEQCKLAQVDTDTGQKTNVICKLAANENSTNLWHDIAYSINHDIALPSRLRITAASSMILIAKGGDGGDSSDQKGGKGSIGVMSTTLGGYYHTYNTYDLYWALGQSGVKASAWTGTDEVSIGTGGASTLLLTRSPYEDKPDYSHLLINAGGGGGAGPSHDGGSGVTLYSTSDKAATQVPTSQASNANNDSQSLLGGAGGCLDSGLNDNNVSGSTWRNLENEQQQISLNSKGNGTCSLDTGGSGGGGYIGGAAAKDIDSQAEAGGSYVAASYIADPSSSSTTSTAIPEALVTDTIDELAADDDGAASVIFSTETDTTPIVVFDIDGTVTVDDLQVDYAAKGYKNVDPTFWPYAQDTVNHYIANGFQVLFLTGRPADGTVFTQGDGRYSELVALTAMPLLGLFYAAELADYENDAKDFETVTEDWLEEHLTVPEGGLKWDLKAYPSVISGLSFDDAGNVQTWKKNEIREYADNRGIDSDDETIMGEYFIHAFSSSSDDIDAYQDARIPEANTHKTDDDENAFDDWYDNDDNFINPFASD